MFVVTFTKEKYSVETVPLATVAEDLENLSLGPAFAASPEIMLDLNFSPAFHKTAWGGVFFSNYKLALYFILFRVSLSVPPRKL